MHGTKCRDGVKYHRVFPPSYIYINLFFLETFIAFVYILICHMQCAVKKLLLIKVGQQTLQDVQTEDLQIAYPSLVVWSAIMGPL